MSQSLVGPRAAQPHLARRGPRPRDRDRRAPDHARARSSRRPGSRPTEEETDAGLQVGGGLAEGRGTQRARWRLRAARRSSSVSARSASSRTAGKIKEKGKGLDHEISLPTFGAPVKSARRRRLHPPVRHDDRRRSADRAVPRHPRHADRHQGVPQDHREMQGRRRSGLDVRRRAAASTPRSSTTSTPTWSPPARSAVSSTPSSYRLANYMEKATKLKSKIKGAMIYPACIVGAAVLVTVHPADLGHPGLRRAVLELRPGACRRRRSSSSTCRTSRSHTSTTLLVAPVIGFVVLRQSYRTEPGHLTIDRLMLKVSGLRRR